jgi:putative Mg2+ transporter-C (MgtC) family protein
VRVLYEDGRGVLRDVLAESTSRGFAIARVGTQHLDTTPATVAVTLAVQGAGSVNDLAVALDGVDGVVNISASDESLAILD